MCGIAGSVNANFSNEAVIKVMGHRGPDEQNDYENNNVKFFHLRLSILDIAGGKQPMHLHGKYTIIFNGEIYNHAEIRKQFNLNGITSSDTETLLLLYEKFGTDFLQYLDGMFAFAIYDKLKNEIFIARDRAGKKPLYYYYYDNKFLFASELNCLKSMVPLEINNDNIYQYLRLGSFYRQCTPYKKVTELTAGTFLKLNCSTLSIVQTQWWNINSFYQSETQDSFQDS
nr:asparagine synthetase B [Bacteroidota bacterium]